MVASKDSPPHLPDAERSREAENLQEGLGVHPVLRQNHCREGQANLQGIL